ncbi:hypothetical protein TUM4637_22000 [Shewanella hafniensis]|nr:hypothetical protein TUM4637_22000 [Shewanella hafniensis]
MLEIEWIAMYRRCVKDTLFIAEGMIGAKVGQGSKRSENQSMSLKSDKWGAGLRVIRVASL